MRTLLHITPEAGRAINRLVAGQGAAGLRIEARHGTPEFAVSIAALPDETDLVVTEETTGARVMLDSLTAEWVEHKTLDVDATVAGTTRFQLADAGTV